MKIYSKGGKYAADPKPVDKRKEITETIPEADAVPAVTPASEARPVRRKQPAHSDKSAERAKISHEERSAARKAESKARKKRNIWITAISIFCVIMIATFLFLLIRKITVTNDYRKLAEQIQQAEERLAATTPTIDIVEPTGPLESSSDSTEPQATEPVPETILPKYAELYEENPEFFGWIRMEDTVLDYPVMRSFEDNDEYLYGNFDGDYCYAGVPFADYKCSRDSDNILIYGHNIRDGSMFRPLFKYEDQSYWEEHPTIMFSDLYGDYEYEILAVFRDRVYYKYEDCFKFYQFIDAEDEADFDYAISQFKEKALYDTGVDAEYGDKLITLITCAYHVDNGRFVVVARRK